MKLFTGTTEECLKHFVEANDINRMDGKEHKIRNALSVLLDVAIPTAYNWFAKFSLPTGENLLRLRYLLELNGYEIVERQAISKVIRDFSDQVSVRAASIKDAAAYISTSQDIIVDVLMGRYGASSQREGLIMELVQLHEKEAHQNLQVWKETLKSLGLMRQSVTKHGSPEPVAKTTLPDFRDGHAVKILAHLLLAIKPLAEAMLSDKFSADDRQKLRELAITNGHSNAVFEVSNLLNRLCSERARTEIK